MQVLFWNTYNNRKINSTLCDLIIEKNISFVILAEYNSDINELIWELNKRGILMKEYPTCGCKRMTVLGIKMNIKMGLQTDYSSFQIINNKDIFCCIHLPSQLHGNHEGRRNSVIRTIVDDIENAEKEFETDNTIIVGDFNINPFDYGCIDALWFNSVPIYKSAKKLKRKIAGKEYRMFYNPMWSFLGDKEKPYGTYYHSGGETNDIFWNIFDQVIIRPCLKKRFVDNSLQIVTEIKSKSILNRLGHPNKKISDHLPITFEIKEENNE